MALWASGVVLSLSPSPRVHWRILKNLPKAWKEIDRTILRRIIREFKYNRLTDFKENEDRTISVVLTEKGKHTALKYNPDLMQIKKPLRWDNKWRFVIFDIPEKKKAARQALRIRLRSCGFYQLQRSVWVYPYECKNEIDFIAELFEVRNHVHYFIAEPWLQDAVLKLHFRLT